jgi:hypothetical protein
MFQTAEIEHPTITNGVRSARRRLSMGLVALALAATSLGAAAPQAVSAASPTATSYGFVCSTNGWVRNQFPNIATGSTTQSTYFRSDLYRWNGAKWVFHASRGWYNGVSSATGRLALGNFLGVPYYWLLNGGAVVDAGAIFAGLPHGYYKTAEYYQLQNGIAWSRWSFVNGSGAEFCYI